MRHILKPMFDLVTGEFVLFDNVLYNYMALALIGLIAFKIAWRFVSNLYKSGMIEGSTTGSIIHWTVRLLVFFVLFLLLSVLLRTVQFLLSVPWWGWLVGIGVLIIGAAAIRLRS